jgi:hypothetical protein
VPRCFVVKNGSNAFSRDFRRDAGATVADCDPALRAVGLDVNVDRAAAFHRLRAVQQQVVQQQAQLISVSGKGR